MTAKQLFSSYLNLEEPPSRFFIQTLSHFCKNEDERLVQKLEEFSSKTSEGKSEYYRYIVREKRNIVEIMFDFKMTNGELPLAYLI